MPRPPRADKAGCFYHALNRGNARHTIFHKREDYEAFERTLAAGLEQYDIHLLSYQLMPNHWHLILSPQIDGEMSRFLSWVTGTHTMRYHAHYHTSGEGHVYQGRFKSFPVQDDHHFYTVCRYVERNALRANFVTSAEDWQWGSLWRWLQKPDPDPHLLTPWPMRRLSNWVQHVNEPLSVNELAEIRKCANRGCPWGDSQWVETIAEKHGLESTMRPRGRPRVRNVSEKTNKES